MAPTIQTARKSFLNLPPLQTTSTGNREVKKPGRPKGKARKWVPAAKAKAKAKRAEAQKPKFPFMQLPLEIRREIYTLVLPRQDSQSHPNGWKSIDTKKNEFMNLLLVNKRVSNEARSVLYTLNTFTMVVFKHRYLLLGTLNINDFVTFPTKPSIPFIKNWQIALWPSYENLRGRSAAQFRDVVLSACSEIAKTQELQTLTLSIPCICGHFQKMRADCRCGRRFCRHNLEEIEDIHDGMISLLAPFNQLRFKGRVKIIAAAEPSQQFYPGARGPYPSAFPESSNTKGHLACASHPHSQCQQPLCLSYAASFDPFRATLVGNTTPLSLTKDQADWLDFKKRMNEHKEHADCEDQLRMGHYMELWNALDSGSSEYWFGVRKRVEEHVLRQLPCMPDGRPYGYDEYEDEEEGENDDW
ncbi:MAG: hypothetical protein Q9169_006758 [Polycauliona sp. 2 TL-2023]